MPTIITHGVSSVILGRSMLMKNATWRLWFWSAICSMVPDADVLGFLFGVKYADFWGHRGFTHSIVFALLFSVLIVFIFNKPLSKIRVGNLFWFIYFSIIVASHGLFDGFTDGGLGVAYFSPFDNARYFFPWTPIMVSPIGIDGIFSARGVRLFFSEFRYIILPILPLLLISFLFVKYKIIARKKR